MLDIFIYILFSLFIAIFFFIGGVLTEHATFSSRFNRVLNKIDKLIDDDSYSIEYCSGALDAVEAMMNKEEKNESSRI